MGKEQALKSASTAIVNKIVGDNTGAVAANAGPSEIDLDFSKAKANDNTYVFTVDATQLGNLNDDFVFTNTNAYDGYSNVLINVTGGSGASMTVRGMRNTPAGVDQVVLASTDGTTLNLTNEQFKKDGANVTVIAPTSNVILSGSATINGFVGAINGDGSGDGYVAQPTTNTYTVQFVDVNDNKKVVGTTTVSGNAGDSSTVAVPDGWALASGASSTVTLTDTPATAIQVPVTQVKTATVTQTITSTAQKSATDATPVTDSDQDDNGNAITYPGKVADLPAAQTRTTTVQYTTEGTGDNTTVNVLSGTTGNVVFDAIEAQNVTGWLEDQTSVANTYLDENALISKLKTLDSENGSVSFDAQLIYYPSSTSVHKTLTFTDHVYFDYADDAEGDLDQLPADFDRTATVGYTETTDYNGTVTRSDFAVEDGDGLEDVTDAQIASWAIAGYSSDATTDMFMTNDGMIGVLEQSGGETQSTITGITYSPADVLLTVTYVDDTTGQTVAIDGQNSETITNLNGEAGTYTVHDLPAGYALADGQSSSVDYTLTPDDADNITIHLTHTYTTSTTTSTRTVQFVTDNGDQAQMPQSVTQTVTWQLVTDNTDGSVVATAEGGYAAVSVDDVAGYKHDYADGVAAENFADTQSVPNNETITVHYTAQLETVTVTYVDDAENGAVVGKTTTLTGLTGSTGTYHATAPDKYVLAKNQSSTVDYTVTPDDSDNITVHLTHALVYGQVQTTRTINYVVTDGDSSKLPASVTQTVTWDTATDAVTGTSVAVARNGYAAVGAPDIAGYTHTAGAPAVTLGQADTTTLADTTYTVTYTAAAATLQVTIVDDVSGKTSTEQLTGTVDATGTYTVTVPAGYSLAEGQSSSVNYTFAADDSDNITVHLTHAVKHTTVTTTRTVNYTINGQSSAKAPASVTQTATWNVATDELTGDAVYTPQSGYTAVQSPTIDGYTADGDVAAISLVATTTAPASATTATVNYTANAETLTVHYVDDVTGNEVSTDTVAGRMDDTGSYSVVTPAHYALAEGQSSSVTYTFTNDDTDDITVHLTHAIDHTTATTTRTINYVIADGDQSKAPAATEQTVTWAVTTDEVTGTSYATAQNAYGAVTSPSLTGYTADGNVAAEVLAPTLTARLENTSTTVTYRADTASLTVHYVDDVTGEQVASATLTGVTDGTGTYQVTVPAKYALSDGQAGSFEYTFAVDNNDDITVHLTHAVDHTNATTTRTINYVVAGHPEKNPASVTQTVTWNISTDEVTGATVATPMGEYASSESPTVNGYTADHDVAALTVGPTAGAPTDAASETVTYTANPASLTVHYVDDLTGEQVTSTALTGVTDGTGTYSVQVPAHYALADGQDAEVDYTFATDDTDDVTIHLTHAIDHTTATTTRTINYVVTGNAAKNPASVTQMLTWNVATDEVTGDSVATPQGNYAAVTSPTVNGYTADGNAAAATVAATTDTPANAADVTVTYTANPATLTVHYVDDVTGEQVTSATLTGVTDEAGTYKVAVPARYVLASGQADSVAYTFATNDTDDVTVHLTHAIAYGTTTTTRTINYVVTGNAAKNPASVTQTLTWSTATDEVTGAVVATPQGEYAAVKSPAVIGYTADGDVSAATVKSMAATPVNAQDVTVTYTANPATLTVHYVDDVTGEQVTSATLKGVTDESGTYKVVVPAKYTLADGQSDEVDYTFATDDTDDVTVHLTHAIAHTTTTTTRTINYVVTGRTDKNPATVTQTFTWNVATDEVTGTAVATPQGGYAAVTSPTVHGYTANGNVTANNVAATTDTPVNAHNVTVTYTANPATLTVHYVDDVTGEQVTSTTLTGVTDESGTYKVQTPAHYTLADGQVTEVGYTFGTTDTDDVTVHLTHAIAHTTTTTTRTINYVVTGNAAKNPASVTQTLTWKVATDEVTGAVTATPQGEYAAVTSPTVNGYTADGDADAAIVTATNATPVDAADVTVTYTANPATLTVRYVDDVTGEQVTSAALKGATDESGTYGVQTPAHYVLADGQATEINYTFTTNDTDDVTVHLTHAIAHTTATTTRTINYVIADGDANKAPATTIQTITWNVVTDEVTGTSYATPTGEYAQVESPAVAGYTADRNVNAAALAPTTTARLANTSTTVTYHANAASLTVTYVDDVTGQTVATQTLTGTTDAAGTYTVAAPTHYVLADGQSRSVNYTFAADDSDDVTVHLTHAVEHTTATTTRTIYFVIDNGDATKAPRTVVQTVTWNVATDAVTGASVATATGTYAAVDAPTVDGYTADGNVAVQTLGAVDTDDLSDSEVTVHYTANDAELTVTYVDDVSGDTVAKDTLTGKTDGTGTYTATIPAHYALADGQSGSVNYTFAADDSDNVTVHLTHAVAHSTATTTRTINYVVTGKAELNPQSVTQTLTWNVATDEVTGAVTATPQGAYAAITSPTVNGYTADDDVSAARVTATTGMPTDAADVTVTYAANPATLTVRYVDDVTGEQVTSATLTGVTDGAGTYTVQTPTHYVLADGQDAQVSYTFAANATDDVTVHLTHAVAHTTTTTTRTVNYTVNGQAGGKAPASVTQTLTWNVATDEVTGAVTATPQGGYAAVASPAVNGYTADRDVDADTVAATSTTPTNADDVTVNYQANRESLTVRYVDDVTGEQVTSATINGVMDGTGSYTVTVPAGYALADGQSRAVAYTLTNDDTDDVTVHLTHAVNHTTATTTRTVNYVVDGGDATKAPATVVQTVTWNVATDAVTGESVATPTSGYAALTSPTVAGYTASGDVAAMTLGAVDATQLADSTTTVHYTADAATLTVTYVDDVTGDTVTTAVLEGTTDGTGTYNVTVPAKYALSDGQSRSVNYTFADDDSDNVTVHLTHAVAHSTATTTRTINYVVSGGDTTKAPASVVQTVTWNVTTDAVTGASYATAQDAYGAVGAPAVAGYTADHGTDAQVLGPVATAALADTTTTVTYTPNDADITVTYVDDTDGSTVETQTLIGHVDGTGTYTVTVPGGYQLADGQSSSLNYVFAADASDNMTVHLTHHFTAGTTTATRTINYVVDGGGTTAPASVTQTVVFATSTDDVTGLTTATPAGEYAAVATPSLVGYTADTAAVTAATPQYADGDTVVTVHYAANAEQLTVRYVDDVTGTTLSTDTVAGTMNQSGVYTVTVPANYELADGQSRAVNYRLTDDDSDDVTVHLTHAMHYGDATTTRTIHYVTADGKAGVAPASVTQVAHWRVVTDLVTGGSIATATDGYAAVTSPTLAGYTASGNVAAAQLGATNTTDLQDTTVTITYTAVAQPDNGGTPTTPDTTPDSGGTPTTPDTTPDNGGTPTTPATTPDSGGTPTTPIPDDGGTPTSPVTTPVTTPSGTTTTTTTVPVTPNVVATTPTPAATTTTTTPVAPAGQTGSSTPATPVAATNTTTPISASGITPDVASMAANIAREAVAAAVASSATDEATRDVAANVGADITDALDANSTDAVAQRAVTPAGVTATILNVGEQSQNRIPGGSSESTYTYFAQKIANAQTREAVQYELLLRQWDSGVNNWVLPSSFGITVGMQTTLMQQALRSLDSGNISINLTTSQFTDDAVVQRLSDFARNQQGQGSLTIELAELPSAAQLASVMPTYHDGGVKVVLGDAQDANSDDAARVANQLDGFKFALQKLRARGEDQQWVSAAHRWQALARDTGGTFTLEGVESDGDLQVARQMGITNVQGFLFGKPAQPTQIDFE